jgi:hypothetical protein
VLEEGGGGGGGGGGARGGGGGGGGGESADGSFVAGESLLFDYLPLWLDLDQYAGPSSGATTLLLQVVPLNPKP